MRLRPIAALFVLLATLAACSPAAEARGELQDTDWVLRSYDQDGSLVLAPEEQYADATFATTRVRGFGGCNDYDARYRSAGPGLFVAGVSASTMMACPPEQLSFEQSYMALLASSRFYSVRPTTLTIFDSSRRTVLVFDAAPRNPVRGAWLVDSYQAAGGSVAGLLPGTEMHVAFGLATVSGNAGCNSFSGTYEMKGSAVRVSRLATTQLACSQAAMDQEAAFLRALQGAALIDMRANRVVLTALDGAVLVNLVRPGAGATPAPSAAPSASPPPTEAPTPTPTATRAPTPTPTLPPTPGPSVGASVAPSGAPSAPVPAPIPNVATCDLVAGGGASVATIAYPGSWHTLASPPNLACRYFDPAAITVPPDPAALSTAVQASTSSMAYAEAVAAATDAASWTVLQQSSSTVDNLAVTVLAATAKSSSAGIPAGSTRFASLVDVGAAGTITIWTVGSVTDPSFVARSAIVSLMTALSNYRAGS